MPVFRGSKYSVGEPPEQECVVSLIAHQVKPNERTVRYDYRVANGWLGVKVYLQNIGIMLTLTTLEDKGRDGPSSFPSSQDQSTLDTLYGSM